MPNDKDYLGDSVYCRTEHGVLVLTTENGEPDDPKSTIVLEPEVYAALERFVVRAKTEGRLA